MVSFFVRVCCRISIEGSYVYAETLITAKDKKIKLIRLYEIFLQQFTQTTLYGRATPVRTYVHTYIV